MARSYVFVIAKPTSHPWGVVSDAEMMAPVSQDSTERSPVVTEERDTGKPPVMNLSSRFGGLWEVRGRKG